jgi:WhiB family redox-sensing transcriptional regulator
MDVNIFVAPEGVRGGILRKNYITALSVCKECSVKQECLDYAMEHEMVYHGIYGGTTPRARQLLIRKRRRETKSSGARTLGMTPNGSISVVKA